MLTVPTTRQCQTECGPQFLPSRRPGNAGGWMTQPKAWKQLSRKVHKTSPHSPGFAN